MTSSGQRASLQKLARRLRALRQAEHLRQADVHADRSSVSRVERGLIPLSVEWVERFEQALGRDDLLDEFRSITEAAHEARYEPSPDRDDFVSRTRLLESRVIVELGETVTIRDRRRMVPLRPPLAGMRLRNAVPPVDGRTPRLLRLQAVGANVLGHFWLQDEVLVLDVAFDPPITAIAPPFEFDVIYGYDVLAQYMTEVVGSPSDYFEVRIRFPSASFEVVSCEGLPESVALPEVRAFRAGQPHRLPLMALTRSHEVLAQYRDLRPAFLYGVFWRATGPSASS